MAFKRCSRFIYVSECSSCICVHVPQGCLVAPEVQGDTGSSVTLHAYCLKQAMSLDPKPTYLARLMTR